MSISEKKKIQERLRIVNGAFEHFPLTTNETLIGNSLYLIEVTVSHKKSLN
jgi:hypothetical protein